jgi:hypothetical protein
VGAQFRTNRLVDLIGEGPNPLVEGRVHGEPRLEQKAPSKGPRSRSSDLVNTFPGVRGACSEKVEEPLCSI